MLLLPSAFLRRGSRLRRWRRASQRSSLQSLLPCDCADVAGEQEQCNCTRARTMLDL